MRREHEARPLAARSLKRRRGAAAGFALGLVVASAFACTTGAKKEAAKTALDAMPRQELGEQVLRETVKDKPALEKALRAAKVIDDDAAPPPPRR